MRQTAESMYIKNTFSIRKSVEKGLIDYKQRFEENLSGMDARDGRVK